MQRTGNYVERTDGTPTLKADEPATRARQMTVRIAWPEAPTELSASVSRIRVVHAADGAERACGCPEVVGRASSSRRVSKRGHRAATPGQGKRAIRMGGRPWFPV